MNPELLKRLDPIARRFGGYTAYTLSTEEFVGLVSPHKQPSLYELGYEKSPTFAGISLEAAKIHPISGDTHDVSLRKIDPQNTRKQYHVHIWLYDPAEVYVHREYRPDIRPVSGESISEMIERLRTHYKPTYGENYEQGEMCDDLEELLA